MYKLSLYTYTYINPYIERYRCNIYSQMKIELDGNQSS